MSPRRRTLIALVVAALAGTGAGIAIGLSEDDEPQPAAGSEARVEDPAVTTPPEAPLENTERPDPELPPEESDPGGAEPGPSGPRPESSDEQAAASASRGYVQALTLRSGAAICRAFAPGTLHGFEFPRERSSCASSVRASLGHAEEGLPVWKSSEMTEAVSAAVDGRSARVVATVFTVYADVREPTIEDDIIHLTRTGGRWLVAKPSLTFHRAMGDPDPPPSVLAPPR